MEPTYEQRTVAFIDILGFSELVQRSLTEPGFLARLNDALRIVEHRGRTWAAQIITTSGNESAEEARRRTSEMDFRSQVFSDCIVLSQRGEVVAPLFISVAQLAMALLDLRVLIRGGIAVGRLYHDERVVFGPALIEAYHLESRCSKFPRVVVSQQALAAARRNLVIFPERGPTGAYFASECLRRDADRMYHLDYLTTALLGPTAIVGADEGELRRRLGEVGGWAVEEFARHTDDADVQAKVGWFIGYFNDFARIRTTPVPELRVEARVLDDDHMDPAATWERLRAAYYRTMAES